MALQNKEDAEISIQTVTAENQSTEPNWVMVIDLSKCIGCKSCTVACKAENSLGTGEKSPNWSPVLEFKQEGDYPDVIEFYIPRPCMHCRNAPCVRVCPTSASHYDEYGLVQINYDICIGCRYCIVACPYGARQFNWKPNVSQPYNNPDVPIRPHGVTEKCTFCIHRLEKGYNIPACVETCISNARIFGDLNDPTSDVSKKLRRRSDKFRLKEELGTDPRVFYLPASNLKSQEDWE